MEIQTFFQPSAQSVSRKTLLLLETKPDNRIKEIFKRCVLVPLLLLSATLDLLWWAGMTITIYPAFQTGLAHLANLTSTLALFALAFTIPFGYRPKIDEARPFCTLCRPATPTIPPTPPLPLTEQEHLEAQFRNSNFELKGSPEQPFTTSDPITFFHRYFGSGCSPTIHNADGLPPIISLINHMQAQPRGTLVFDDRGCPDINEIEEIKGDLGANEKDSRGFGVLTYLLTGIYFHSGSYSTLSFHAGSDRERLLAERLISKEPTIALPPTEMFIEYKEKLDTLSTHPHIPEEELARLKESENELIRLFACAYESFPEEGTYRYDPRPRFRLLQCAREHNERRAPHYDKLVQLRHALLRPYRELVDQALSEETKSHEIEPKLADLVLDYI